MKAEELHRARLLKDIDRPHIKLDEDTWFWLCDGICGNVDLSVILRNTDIRAMWAYEFGKNEIYPIGGRPEFISGRRRGTLWTNPKRWEYIEFLLNKCKKSLELLNE